MIASFRHRGLRILFENDDQRRLPGFGLHRLKGDLKDFWAVSVSGNWCIIFRFENSNAYDVDLVDYH